LNALGNDELYIAIEEFAKTQPSEGWRHDYTLQWTDTALAEVAGFANTFGGILIVGGKKEKTDVTCELLGVESETEYKTRIASSIAANISPVPSYEVFECHKPRFTNLKFCVIRVREARSLHLVTKKNLSPVYVRNEDQAIPANASQLRRLIDRERETPDLAAKLADRMARLRDAMAVNCGYQDKDSERWFLSPHQASQTYLKLEMIINGTVLLELDDSHENKLSKFVAELYPRICDTVQQDVAKQSDGRHADFYEYAAYHKNLDRETRWRIMASGDIGHATQIRHSSESAKNVWSVVDVARSIILFNELAMKWWEDIGYFGEGFLHAQLSTDGMDVLRHPQHGYFIQAFDPTFTPMSQPKRSDIRKDAISLATLPGNYVYAEAKVTYSRDEHQLARITTTILNQLLRSLGHIARKSLLQNSIESLLET